MATVRSPPGRRGGPWPPCSGRNQCTRATTRVEKRSATGSSTRVALMVPPSRRSTAAVSGEWARPSSARLVSAPPAHTAATHNSAKPSVRRVTTESTNAPSATTSVRRAGDGPARSPNRMPTITDASARPGPTRRSVIRSAPSDHHAVAELGEAFLADAAHLAQLVDRPEAAATVALGDDRARERGTDPRQRLELRAGGVVEVDDGTRARIVAARAGCGLARRSDLADLRHQDSLAVDQLGGEVEAVEIGIGETAARAFDGVDDAGANRQRDHTGRLHRAGHVHGHSRAGRAHGGAEGATRGGGGDRGGGRRRGVAFDRGGPPRRGRAAGRTHAVPDDARDQRDHDYHDHAR